MTTWRGVDVLVSDDSENEDRDLLVGFGAREDTDHRKVVGELHARSERESADRVEAYVESSDGRFSFCPRRRTTPAMADVPDVQTVETEDEYIHVRFRDPDEFGEIRTPDWAENPAHDVSEGSEVRTGRREGSDDWEVQSVLIEKSVGEDEAREQAEEIVEKIES